MKCPVCANELVRTKYEGLSVLRCVECFGYLVGRQRVEGIKRVRDKSVEELKRETLDEARADSESALRCPRCRAAMHKRFLQEPASFHIDLCNECELVWFDGGELARYQLAWEISEKGRDSAEFQRRMREMTPEAKRQLEENIEKLPEPSAFWGGLREAVIEALFSGHSRPRW